ncbi:type IV secretory system conjugative DNA transfer family protein [Pedobacter nutrimenti]|uniref:Type IV secretory pathway TraG/TraD family ATPase VirD4 n=1 Tax=Pedobacter nutrimenti TaxID=1241337 RepID=A0A318UDK4_9SPHI|nr:type IV secretion system DNA-binding domain-containing protein [Pedobacter nutrimenti]PYF68464.1 type IV secretory pathway TraG/TraD family ATPase VirD4 [Pedobacter nutrimenti]
MKKEANVAYSFLGICSVFFGLQYYYYLFDNNFFSSYLPKINFAHTTAIAIGFVLRIGFVLGLLICCYLFKKYSVSTISKRRSLSYKVLIWLSFIPASLFFILVTDLPFIGFNYPLSFFLVITSCVLIAKTVTIGNGLKDDFDIKSDQNPLYKEGGFVIPLVNDKYINIPVPNAGISVIASAGSGKTESIAFPIIEQMTQEDFASITFDYKFPVLASKIYHELVKVDGKINNEDRKTCWIINFMDPTRTHRTNVLHQSLLQQVTFATQYSKSLVSNLMPESIKNPDFWMRSSTALLTGTMWYLKKNYPQFCTLPHVIAIINNGDTIELVNMLMSDMETDGLVSSIHSAIQRHADNQIAGVLSTLQTAFAVINTKNIFWVLSGNDFVLNVNDPKNPKHVIIGNDSQVSEALNPIISCMMTIAIKKMISENKKRSVVLMDEAAQLYIPNFPNIPAVCRSYGISVICLAQSISQYEDLYGPQGSQTLMDNLNTQIYGRTRSTKTARYVSELFGKEEKVTYSQNTSVNSSLSGGGNSLAKNESYQLKDLVRPKDVLNLKTGEFYGLTMGTEEPYFHGMVKREIIDEKIANIPAFSTHATPDAIEKNYVKIREEAMSIFEMFRNNKK